MQLKVLLVQKHATLTALIGVLNSPALLSRGTSDGERLVLCRESCGQLRVLLVASAALTVLKGGVNAPAMLFKGGVGVAERVSPSGSKVVKQLIVLLGVIFWVY